MVPQGIQSSGLIGDLDYYSSIERFTTRQSAELYYLHISFLTVCVQPHASEAVERSVIL